MIEQLGGYEEAKMLRGTTSNALLDMKTWTVHVDDIDSALLEYRRANNIFEVGDKVVYKGEAGLDGLFEIERLTKTGKPKTVKTERFGNFPCRYCEVQHATDAEIQAGRRL